jgi:hypothetical protein
MEKTTTGTAMRTRRASSGTIGLVGNSPPSRAAGSAGLMSDGPPRRELAVRVPAPFGEAVPGPVPPVVPVADELPVPPVVPATDAPELPPDPLADPPGALPIGGSGGGEESAPRLPLKVGLLQFDAFSCCAG